MSMFFDEDETPAQRLLRMLVGIQQDRDIADLMESLKSTPDFTDTPMPDTAHPALSHVADFVRSSGLETVAVAAQDRSLFCDDTLDTLPTHTLPRTELLHQRKCAGPAPYVGRRAVYVWDAWSDDRGRSITGPAMLVRL